MQRFSVHFGQDPKSHMYRFLLMLSFLVFVGCKKDSNNNTSLVGKWKVIQIYEGYVMGGCFCWKLVASQDAPIIEFKPLGKYKITQPPHFSTSGCSGTYRLLNDSTIAMTSDCQADPNLEFNRRYTREGNVIIIDYQGIEGVIRYKYMKM